jgi:hypothetical protein
MLAWEIEKPSEGITATILFFSQVSLAVCIR